MGKGEKEAKEDKDTQKRTKIFSEAGKQEIGRKKGARLHSHQAYPVHDLTLYKSLNVTGTVMLFQIN